ncbi:MAG: hypothetical protein JSU61_06275 [Fidelibacterota bacterium]|nr:MAG: hypothetical protein JSU61_06275 [Candidatus Neomarinimicrobiota bacterium]
MHPNKQQAIHPLIPVLAGMILSLVVIPGSGPLVAQEKRAVIRANRVWCGMVEYGGSGGAFNYASSWFPADYNCMGPSMERGSGMTGSNIATASTNWTDPDGILIAKAAIRPLDHYTNWYVSSPMTNYIRWAYPTSIVNYDNVTLDEWGDVDPSKMVGTSDQTAEVAFVNAMGVEIKRRVFAWSQQFHDNYIVVDVVLTNRSGETLTDFWVSMRQGPYYWRKAKGSTGSPSIPDQDDVDRAACWHHYYGARPADSLRVFYMYHADEPDRVGDQMGGPIASQDGRLLESDITFYTILHASQAPYTDPTNDIDDPLQPRVTDVYDNVPMGVNWLVKPSERGDLIYDLIAGKNGQEQPMEGQYEGAYHRANNDEQNDPDWSNLGVGFIKGGTVFNQSICAFGPYETFEDGQSLHIVYASGYTGIGIEKEKEIGEKWLYNTLEEPPNLPDAELGYFPAGFAYPPGATEVDSTKDRWISTGIDSVHKAASRALWNFKHDWQVPGSPPPPSQEITGHGDGVEIKWSDPDVEALDGFAGYRILRRVGRADTVFFDIVHQTDATDLASEHTWTDTSILFGASYYYYVQAGYRIAESDPNAYPGSRGKTIWSGRLWNPTEIEVQPPRYPGEKLSDIRIVPNPYNIRDPLMADYGWSDDRGLMFFNLPAEVTIRIFTESGDLVRTIPHKPRTRAGSLTWNMLTDSQQAIATGMYIAVFETPDGSVAYQKFIVVR